MKGIRYMVMAGLLVACCTSVAQSYSYNHDPAKLNQITIMESGTGTFQPSWYYQSTHRSYSASAASTCKTSYRTNAGSYLYLQQKTGDSIKSYMNKRASIEALNLADRAGGSADLAWSVEGPKLNAVMGRFMSNINRVIQAGGSIDERKYWLQYYNLYQCAIQYTQDAYIPNAQRKREYLRIYSDAFNKNELLVRYLVRLNNRTTIRERLSALPDTTRADKRSIVAMAMTRWSSSIGLTSNQPSIEE